jgi:hypothetical protein
MKHKIRSGVLFRKRAKLMINHSESTPLKGISKILDIENSSPNITIQRFQSSAIFGFLRIYFVPPATYHALYASLAKQYL